MQLQVPRCFRFVFAQRFLLCTEQSEDIGTGQIRRFKVILIGKQADEETDFDQLIDRRLQPAPEYIPVLPGADTAVFFSQNTPFPDTKPIAVRLRHYRSCTLLPYNNKPD